MSMQIADNFSYQGTKPLDARIKYATVADMKAVADSSLYDGCMAYVTGVKKYYTYDSTNTVDSTTGKWREYESGGGHVIKDESGTAMTERDNLQFKGLNVSDDSTNGATVVDGSGKALSTAIAPVFDATETYAEGDRVMYEDELYVFNTAHTGAWAAADADKSDVDSEIPTPMPAADMSEVASPMPGVMSRLPILFDETGTEQVVGWYKYANGTKKPVYRKFITNLNFPNNNAVTTDTGLSYASTKIVRVEAYGCWGDDELAFLPYTGTLLDYMIQISIAKSTSISNNWMVRLKSIADRTFMTGYAILEYTKTTDTAQ